MYLPGEFLRFANMHHVKLTFDSKINEQLLEVTD